MVTIEESGIQRSATIRTRPAAFRRICSAIDKGHKMTWEFHASADIILKKGREARHENFVPEGHFVPIHFFPWYMTGGGTL